MSGSPWPMSANDGLEPGKMFARNIALALGDADTNAALSDFVIALARNQARIDHVEAIGANDNTKH